MEIGSLMKQGHRGLIEFLATTAQSKGYAGLAPSLLLVFGAVAADGTTRIGSLARDLGITKQSAGQMIKELKSLGYVVLDRDQGDARVQAIRLTERGESLQQTILKSKVVVRKRIALAMEDEDLAALHRLLTAFCAAVPSGDE